MNYFNLKKLCLWKERWWVILVLQKRQDNLGTLMLGTIILDGDKLFIKNINVNIYIYENLKQPFTIR